MKILIADDNSDSLYLLDTLLKKSGYKTIKVENGAEALKKLKKNKVDVIISDILMPKKDGFKLCRECKKDKKLKEIPFLIYTATYKRKQDEEFALRIGADRFIIKPQEPENLLEIINDVISKRKKKISGKQSKELMKEQKYLAGHDKRVVKKLEDKVKSLNKEISRRGKTEDELGRRVKELKALYSLANLSMKHDISMEKLFRSAIKSMRMGMQYPELVCGRVMFDKREIRTDNFKNTKWKEYRDIMVGGKKKGAIEAYYVKKKPGSGKTIFSREEKRLINGTSEIISVYMDQKLSEEKLEESCHKINTLFDCITKTLAYIIEVRDPYTSGHQKKVAMLASAIAEEIGLDEETVEAINTTALIHDIGKLKIPASILTKPGKLTDVEFKMIKTHPSVGYEMLKDIEFPYPVADIVLQHHERLDGSGYPKGLKSKDISLEAKIIAVAGAMEAMTSHRPYRPSLGLETAIGEIKKVDRKKYDQKIVDISIKILRNNAFRKNVEMAAS
ncbi:MAG: response regulator [Actinomycetota bacterium]|nr:response regulator [Actinomycetota bacterium]